MLGHVGDALRFDNGRVETSATGHVSPPSPAFPVTRAVLTAERGVVNRMRETSPLL